jgi:secreted trypsin-like serine protease
MKAKYLVVALCLFSAVGCRAQVPIQVGRGQVARQANAALISQAFEYASQGAPSDQQFYERFKRKLNELAGKQPEQPGELERDSDYLRNVRTMARDAANGKLEPNVVGGNPTPSNEFRDCVAIMVGGERSSGVLIGRNVIATAAHCVHGKTDKTIKVLFGSSIQSPEATYVVASGNVHVYPKYDANQNELHDLAILILSSDVSDPKPCPIAAPGVVDGSAYVRLAGFGIYDANTGKNGVKHDVSVAVTSPACAKSRENTLYGCHKDQELVAGKPLVGKDTCNGDSGGPAYVSIDNRWFVGSTTSRPTKTAKQCGDGGIYVRIDREPYRSWINSIPSAHW